MYLDRLCGIDVKCLNHFTTLYTENAVILRLDKLADDRKPRRPARFGSHKCLKYFICQREMYRDDSVYVNTYFKH